MGYTPEQFYQMSVWEFVACVKGWNKSHGVEKPDPPSEEEFDQAISRMVH